MLGVDASSFLRTASEFYLARIFHKELPARRDKPASTSLRLLAVSTVLFQYDSARQASHALYPRPYDASRVTPCETLRAAEMAMNDRRAGAVGGHVEKCGKTVGLL